MSKNIRYIRDYLTGSTALNGNFWVQIAAWDDARTNNTLSDSSSNRAFNKTVTSTDSGGSGRTVSQICDGDIATGRYFGGGAGQSEAYVQVDLGALYNISSIQVWHYYGDGRIFKQHKLLVSADGSTWTTVQQSESCVKESASGTNYWLPLDLGNSGDYTKITQKKISQALDYINDVNRKRNNTLHSTNYENLQ